jgi:Ca2+-binding EF-hand superfamily protein
LLSKLLEKDENKRIRVMDCFEHPFLTGVLMKKESEEINAENLKNLLNIKKPKSKFHEIIISYLCFNFIDKSEEKKLSDLFKFIDKDHNNVIKERDIKGAFERNGIEYTEEQINNILNVFEYENNSFIQYQEFLRALCDKQDLFKEENLKIVFNAIDHDKTNYINGDDIKKFVAHDEDNKNIIEKEYMEPFGMKSNDKMIYEQFCEIIREDKIFSEVNDMNNKINK